MKKKNNNPCLGSTFESFLKEEEILEEVEAEALKMYLAHQIRDAIKQSKISQTALAQKMGTSRAAIQRILDPTNPSITLKTLNKIARALGKDITISIK